MNEYNGEDFIISTMRWSFSRLNSFDQCPYGWYRHYVECEPDTGGFFSAYGGYCHEILEKYAKGELSIFDISQYYQENFNEGIPFDAPPNKYTDIRQDYFDKGLDYFDNIDLPIDEYEIVGVEKQVEFNVGEYPFIGFIDLLLRDPADGKLISIDHKSSSIKILKSGKVSKSDQQHFLEFKRQQYLYSIALINEFGENCVKELRWNMFKDRNWINIPFDKTEFDEAQSWALDTIHRIEVENEWRPNPNPFFCRYICGQSNCCPYKV